MKWFSFQIAGWPNRSEIRAETRSKARYKLWRHFSEVYPCTFGEFQRRCT